MGRMLPAADGQQIHGRRAADASDPGWRERVSQQGWPGKAAFRYGELVRITPAAVGHKRSRASPAQFSGYRSFAPNGNLVEP